MEKSILPKWVAHADWSINRRKRWLAEANLVEGVYHLKAARPLQHADYVLDSDDLLLGVDFPLGLPLAYAKAIGVASFRAFIESVRRGEHDSFFEVADSAENISLARPFYPKRPGGTKQQHLLDGLGFANKRDLYRWCDRETDKRRAGANIFWTMGANQIGKGMLAGWRELLLPNWDNITLWPFDGSLTELAFGPNAKPVVAEAYPGEFYHHFGMFAQRGSKRSQAVRQHEGTKLLGWAERQRVTISAELQTQITSGFGPKPDGEDPFDAVVGLFGMLNVVLNNQADIPKLPDFVYEVEGWVFGQTELPKQSVRLHNNKVAE